MATREQQVQDDIKDLHGLGYAQELFRTMGGFSNFAISFALMSEIASEEMREAG